MPLYLAHLEIIPFTWEAGLVFFIFRFCYAFGIRTSMALLPSFQQKSAQKLHDPILMRELEEFSKIFDKMYKRIKIKQY